MTTRRGPDVARWPDIVHHCSSYSFITEFYIVPLQGYYSEALPKKNNRKNKKNS